VAEPIRIEDRKDVGDGVEAVLAVKRRNISASNALVAVLTLLAALWGAWWLYDRLTNVYVQDARVASDMLLLSSRVPGWVVEVAASESAVVSKGDTLLVIDSRSATAHLEDLSAAVSVLDAEIETVLARIHLVEQRTDSHYAGSTARLDAARSGLSAARSDLEVAEADWQRAGPLRERNLLSQQEWETERNEYRTATQTARRREAEVATAQADLSEVESERAEIDVLKADLHTLEQRREQALRQRERAYVDLVDHTLTSPIDGVIDELFIDPGEYVAPGQRLLIMHDTERVWVKANVKETDIRHLHEGQTVSVTVDAYPDQVRSGTVRRIGESATSQFALLPNPNPSGNFTKITQRLEVAIDLAEQDPRLKPGMMVEVKIRRGE
jgi:membrane fusion protein (multidrug efflux system)